jgi:hypothetical protein
MSAAVIVCMCARCRHEDGAGHYANEAELLRAHGVDVLDAEVRSSAMRHPSSQPAGVATLPSGEQVLVDGDRVALRSNRFASWGPPAELER